MLGLKEIYQAKKNLEDIVLETPLLKNESLSREKRGRLYFKCENLQKTGSLKIRGAYNCAVQLTQEDLKKGLVTGSSGNHGIAVSYAASLLQTKAVIVVPQDASAAKVKACQKYGAEVVFHGLTTTERLAKAEEFALQGMTLIHPYDHPHVVAGQGTIGLEIFRSLPQVDYVFVPVGGGGLLSGVATALKELGSSAKIVGVEPVLSSRLRLALAKGEPWELERWQPSIADGIRSKKIGQIAYHQAKKYVDQVISVEEEEIREATRALIEATKLWAEPSAAITLAAYWKYDQEIADKNCVCLLSGGNIEIGTMAEIIGG